MQVNLLQKEYFDEQTGKKNHDVEKGINSLGDSVLGSKIKRKCFITNAKSN